MIENEVTPDFEQFDFNSYEIEKKNILNNIGGVNYQGSSNKKIFSPDSTIPDGTIREYDQNNNLIKEIYKGGAGATQNEYLSNLFCYSKNYFGNGFIESKGVGCVLGFSVGKQYFFTPEGQLKAVKDNDVGYAFGYEEVFKFCKQNGIEVKSEIKAHRLTIEKRKEPNNTTVWFIKNPDDKKREYNYYVLDGKTGHLLRSGNESYINDGL